MNEQQLIDFVVESNSIERIFREPFQEEIDELKRFIALPKITIEELQKFVKVYQPDARLRDKYGLNVRVGNYCPPAGGQYIIQLLQTLLDRQRSIITSCLHITYERIHPFTDGNGRSGRALWLWSMLVGKKELFDDSFLATFYMQEGPYQNGGIKRFREDMQAFYFRELASISDRPFYSSTNEFKFLDLMPKDD